MTTTITRRGPKLSTDQLDHVDLWKYFESRGQNLKTAMLSLITWLTGFAGAVLAFALKEGMNFKTPGPLHANAPLSGLLGLLGLGIVVYSHVIIYEYADHINRTFDRSDKVRSLDSSLDAILGPWETHPPRMPAICRHARNVMRVFGTAFLLLLVTAMAYLLMQ